MAVTSSTSRHTPAATGSSNDRSERLNFTVHCPCAVYPTRHAVEDPVALRGGEPEGVAHDILRELYERGLSSAASGAGGTRTADAGSEAKGAPQKPCAEASSKYVAFGHGKCAWCGDVRLVRRRMWLTRAF
ncbi:hypothetical protein PsYK624_159940 [Phanerochaete sordida]|uniref:Uncharacterized protein n=1 Tax=Phanerochaete sordida TaxID=48140 RepID=A0A9P3GPY8_9APHY|nr:hypothetical protein PsYK624_159940 [Phanerochaete sordida]